MNVRGGADSASHPHNLRIYGNAPYCVAVIHGGPGAAGYMAPVARELSSALGVLEPLQTAPSIEGQVQELRAILEKNGEPPHILIGSSWGAMLSYLLAARYPRLVKKLILVGSAPYEESYAEDIERTRLSRLEEKERREARILTDALDDPAGREKDALLERLARLYAKSDAFDPETLDLEFLSVRHDLFQSVWAEAARMRRDGALLEIGRKIRCPVVAIHGDYDPHPAKGVEEPLTAVLENFRFILLRNCGHYPWIERQAKESFYKILRNLCGLSASASDG
jgi:pimeloyl-ACP methyl ester carboxylesterase